MLADDLASQLRMVTLRLARVLRQPEEDGVSPTLLSALGTVARCGPLTLGRLAELESVQPPSMTRVASRLEELGLIVRQVDDHDRRVARVSLTPKAEQLLAEVRSRRTELLASRLADLSAEELAALDAALPALEHLAGGRS